ncbi:MAG TPA: uroporphyrinogen-III C-methyltransferase [Chloroflexota bacterium]|nr:uroporphyrinogen-III C-methyltransferase [Chloroflexota bacterium]
MPDGIVYLVGGGPGDPGLLTLKGKRVLEQADVVVYDYLVDEQLLAFAPGAELIPARDLHGNRAEQQRINELLIEHARQGKRVVRLKGGDPYLFGRGGEEGQALHAAGIPFQVLPGVTSALAVPAYAGIPVTHRDHSSSVTILPGRLKPGKGEDAIDWHAFARADTLVFLMSVTNLAEVVGRLIEHGRAPSTPAAAVRWGTRPEQQVVTSCLADLPRAVSEAGLTAPAVIVVGEVVHLREQLSWFERLPLFGCRVLVTRPREQSEAFAASLREAGALVYEVPVIELLPPEDWTPVDAAIQGLPGYDWLVFTSANGVRRFLERVWASGLDARALASARLCAIGPETARALKAYGLRADLTPEEYVAEAVASALAARKPERVLIPRAKVARDVLPHMLRESGAQVDVVEVYRTECPPGAAERLAAVLPRVDVVTFTSSSTVANFVRLAGPPPPGVKVACIGPITAQSARDHGLRVDVVAEAYTTEGLTHALVADAATQSTSTSINAIRS